MDQCEIKMREYHGRINRVIDYIETNIDHEFTLDELAGVSFFSKYHFHRIFNSVMGETLFSFIQRIRIERAAALLVSEKGRSITDIAYRCGFSSSAHFTRSFKSAFGVIPSVWRRKSGGIMVMKSNQSQHRSNQVKEYKIESSYAEYINNTIIWRIKMDAKEFKVEVKELPEMNVAYVRNVGPYKEDPALFEKLFGKICGWAGPRGLMAKSPVFIVIYHDNPEITAEEKLRISVCLEVPSKTEVSGEVGKMTIPGGTYAVAKFHLKQNEFVEAWNLVYGVWLPQSGYQPDDRPCFEMYTDEPSNGIYPVNICIPVKPM